MVIVDQTEPADIVDRLLWHDARLMLEQHVEPGHDGNCVWCGWQWPCTTRRIAERAEAASRRRWRDAWTLRHDLNSIRAMPGMRASVEDQRDTGPGRSLPGGGRRARHAVINGRYFG